MHQAKSYHTSQLCVWLPERHSRVPVMLSGFMLQARNVLDISLVVNFIFPTINSSEIFLNIVALSLSFDSASTRMRPWTAVAVHFDLLFILLHHARFIACRDCYDMDGRVMPGDIACHAGLEHSFCCGSMWTCLTQGICSDLNTTDSAISGTAIPALQRATCTDPTWSTDQCPKFCPTSKQASSPSSSCTSIRSLKAKYHC